MIRVPESIPYEEVPLEKRYRAATRALSARIGALYRRAIEEFGDEVLELIRSVSRRHGRDLAEDLCDVKTRHDVQSVTFCLARLLDLVGMEGQVTEVSPQLARIRIDGCPYGISQPELCDATTALESEFIRTLNKDLRLMIEKCAAAGDESCQLRIQMLR